MPSTEQLQKLSSDYENRDRFDDQMHQKITDIHRNMTRKRISPKKTLEKFFSHWQERLEKNSLFSTPNHFELLNTQNY